MKTKADDLPAYIRIMEDIKKQILDGVLCKGASLPPQRKLAEMYNVSRFTITQALEILEYLDLIKINPGHGCTVSSGGDNISTDWLSFFKFGARPNSWWDDTHIEKNISRPYGRTPGIAFDFGSEELIRRANEIAINRLFSKDEYESLDVTGTEGLRKAYSAFLETQGIKASPDEILIVSGGALAVSIVFHGLLSKGVSIFHSDSFFYNSINKLKNTNASMISLPTDSEGIIPDKLVKHTNIFNNSVIYFEPTAAEPAGQSMSLKRKNAILDIIASSTMPIIENEQKRNLWHTAPPSKTFKEMMPQKVIYIDSIANTICPHMQIAAIVAPKLLIARFRDIKIQLEFYTPLPNQLIMEEIFKSEGFEPFLSSLPAKLAERCSYMDSLLRKYCGDILSWQKPEAGIYFWLKLKNNMDTNSLVDALSHQKDFHLRVLPGSRFLNNDTSHIELCFTNVVKDRLEDAVIKFRSIYDKQMGQA